MIMNWSTACPDWERRVMEQESLIPFPPLFPGEAQESLDIFKELRIVDVQGRPKMSQACRQWVFDFVSAIFGAYDANAGRRLINEFFLLISKKNTKSTIAAAIMLTALIRNWRDSAEFLILAPTIEVANNSFDPARDMIRADEELAALFHVQEHYRKITHRGNNSSLKIVAADSEAVSGKKATGVLVDEAWLFGKKSAAENMFREACGGLASRPEGFVIWLSTMSDETPVGIFRQKLYYARGVRDGEIDDPSFLPVIYEFPEKMIKKKAYKDPKNFYVTNPNLGASVDLVFLEREFKKAEIAGDESMAGFTAKHLNVEMGLSLRSQNWAGAPFWEKQGRSEITLEYIIEHCEVIVIGADGGGLDDMLGLAVLGREQGTRNWLLWNRAWLHPIALERRKENVSFYRDFAKSGDLTIVDDIGQDISQFGDIVQKCNESGLLDRIGVDPSGVGDIVDEIERLEIETDRIVGVPQGWRLNGAIKTTERKLAGKGDGSGALYHAASPLMAWCAGNAKVEPRGNAIIITKQVSGSGKIDPIMATFCAVALMAMNPEARNAKSIYETRGILSF